MKRVWDTSNTLFVLAAHPHRGELIGSRGFLNHNSAFNSVHNPVVNHTGIHEARNWQFTECNHCCNGLRMLHYMLREFLKRFRSSYLVVN